MSEADRRQLHPCGCVALYRKAGASWTRRFAVRCMKRDPKATWHRYGSMVAVPVRDAEVPKA